MKKTEIAKLVQIERQRDFEHFCARELAAVDAFNTGEHGKLLTPLEKPTDEQLSEAFTVSESMDYWDQFFSKRLTLEESAGLLMALKPSQVRLAAHYVGRKIPKKNWPSYLMTVELLDAFKTIRGNIEVALQKKDLFADSDDKYGVGDLIEWAKEKNFVADEVLEAWEAYQAATKKPQTNTDSNDGPNFEMLATRHQLIQAFGAFTGMDAKWFDNLKDTPKLRSARKVTGKGGRGHIAEPLFCPYEVMVWLVDKKRRKGKNISNDTAWRLLERHFPEVYNERRIGDPREGVD
jgi:hypothetical protein